MNVPTQRIVIISAKISPLKIITNTNDAIIGSTAISCISTIGVATVRSIAVLLVSMKNVDAKCKIFSTKKLSAGMHKIISSKSLLIEITSNKVN